MNNKQENAMASEINKHLAMIKEFRDVTGLPTGSGADCNIETHRKVIREELEEAADGLTDTLVTLGGLALDASEHKSEMAKLAMEDVHKAMETIGLIPEMCMHIVQVANVSKLCTNSQDVSATKEYYELKLGITTEHRVTGENMIAVFSAEDQDGSDGKHYPKGKLLKCIYWHKPDWSKNHWMSPFWRKLLDCED